jgi:hypothetical protein
MYEIFSCISNSLVHVQNVLINLPDRRTVKTHIKWFTYCQTNEVSMHMQRMTKSFPAIDFKVIKN